MCYGGGDSYNAKDFLRNGESRCVSCDTDEYNCIDCMGSNAEIYSQLSIKSGYSVSEAVLKTGLSISEFDRNATNLGVFRCLSFRNEDTDENFETCSGDISNASGVCAEGYAGPLCAYCAPNFNRAGAAAKCKPCSGEGVQIGYAGFLAAVVIGGFIVFIVFISKIKAEADALADKAESADEKATKRAELFSLIKIAISSMQILGSLEFTMRVEWPDTFSWVTRLLSVFSFDPGQFLQFGCLTPKYDYYMKFAFAFMVLPTIVFSVAIAFHFQDKDDSPEELLALRRNLSISLRFKMATAFERWKTLNEYIKQITEDFDRIKAFENNHRQATMEHDKQRHADPAELENTCCNRFINSLFHCVRAITTCGKKHRFNRGEEAEEALLEEHVSRSEKAHRIYVSQMQKELENVEKRFKSGAMQLKLNLAKHLLHLGGIADSSSPHSPNYNKNHESVDEVDGNPYLNEHDFDAFAKLGSLEHVDFTGAPEHEIEHLEHIMQFELTEIMKAENGPKKIKTEIHHIIKLMKKDGIIEIVDKRQTVLFSCIQLLLTLTFLAYPMVSATMFQAFNSRRLGDDEKWLDIDHHVDSAGAEYRHYFFPVAVVGMLLFPIGVPTYSVYKMSKNFVDKDQGISPAASEKFKFFIADYKPLYFYWDCVEMLRKTAITSLVFVPPEFGVLFHKIIAMMLCLVFMSLTAFCKPYKSEVANIFKLGTEAALVLTLMLSTMLNEGGEHSGAQDALINDQFVGFMLVTVNVVMQPATLLLGVTAR